MPEITVTVADKIARTQAAPVIVCGNSDYTVRFVFDDEWAPYTAKTARFSFVLDGTRRYYDVLFSGDSVAVPVLSGIYEVEIGVYAGDIHTTTPARVPCARAITDGAGSHAEPPADLYDQLLEYLAALENGAGTAGYAVPRLSSAGQTVIGYAETEE